MSERSAKDDGHARADGNNSSLFPPLCFTADDKICTSLKTDHLKPSCVHNNITISSLTLPLLYFLFMCFTLLVGTCSVSRLQDVRSLRVTPRILLLIGGVNTQSDFHLHIAHISSNHSNVYFPHLSHLHPTPLPRHEC